MRFLEISDGISINIEEIESLKKVDDFTTKVYCHYNEYTANFPYMTLLAIIDGMKEEKPIAQPVIDNKAQFWAG